MNINTEIFYGNQGKALLVLALIVLALFVLVALWINTIVPFVNSRDYIKMEMNRSFDEARYLFWKKELRKTYFRYIPFIGRFFR